MQVKRTVMSCLAYRAEGRQYSLTSTKPWSSGGRDHWHGIHMTKSDCLWVRSWMYFLTSTVSLMLFHTPLHAYLCTIIHSVNEPLPFLLEHNTCTHTHTHTHTCNAQMSFWLSFLCGQKQCAWEGWRGEPQSLQHVKTLSSLHPHIIFSVEVKLSYLAQ